MRFRAAIVFVLTLACLPTLGLRPPAVPLVIHDPYFSIWSCADRLADGPTRHWTGRPHRLTGLVRIDKNTYRLLGDEPKETPVLPQVSSTLRATRTIVQYAGAGVEVTLTFVNPLLPQDLDLLSRPATYVTWSVRSTDGKPHQVSVYFEAAAELAVNDLGQQVNWTTAPMGQLSVASTGSVDQPVLERRGDDLRIDWGRLYLAGGVGMRVAAAPADAARAAFAAGTALPTAPRGAAPAGQAPALCATGSLGNVGSEPVATRLIIAYDDEFGIEYFGEHLRPYWRRNGADARAMLQSANSECATVLARCAKFDDEIQADLEAVGGAKYADIATLAFGQCFAANKLCADSAGKPLLFPKENFSNGCIATVDILYPQGPQLLLFSPALARASLQPILDYAQSPRWKWAFAPHDLGTYPQANGQVYGGGERTEENQMPVEETGNMILLMAGICRAEGSPDYAASHWKLLEKWAQYLLDRGLDPENQLCTDDFAGHLAHNANLSAKAIVAIGAFADLCRMRGLREQAEQYRARAVEFAGRWQQMAADKAGYRLAFDRPGTWSQKYNIAWDNVLRLGLFPAEVRRAEMDNYLGRLGKYGLPLDSRQAYTKLDWITWTATLTGNRSDLEKLIAPIHTFLNETPDRVPMTDWYQTDTGRKTGFQARSAVGGVFMPMLNDPAMWSKWAGRSTERPTGWAPLPTPPAILEVVPTAETVATEWRYTTTQPTGKWMAADYKDATWQVGKAGFGSPGTPGATVRTAWTSSDIWLRRQVVVGGLDIEAGLVLNTHHDEDAEVYLNGVLAARMGGYSTGYGAVKIAEAAMRALKPGTLTIAVHCHQTTGGQYIDVGLARIIRK